MTAAVPSVISAVLYQRIANQIRPHTPDHTCTLHAQPAECPHTRHGPTAATMVFWRRRSTDGRTRKSCDGLDAATGAGPAGLPVLLAGQPRHYKACTLDILLHSGSQAPRDAWQAVADVGPCQRGLPPAGQHPLSAEIVLPRCNGESEMRGVARLPYFLHALHLQAEHQLTAAVQRHCL